MCLPHDIHLPKGIKTTNHRQKRAGEGRGSENLLYPCYKHVRSDTIILRPAAETPEEKGR